MLDCDDYPLGAASSQAMKFATFTDEDGEPLAIDPEDAVGVGIGQSDQDEDRTITRIYCQSGDWWAVQDDFEDVKKKLELYRTASEQEPVD